jgi:hypothetical protein
VRMFTVLPSSLSLTRPSEPVARETRLSRS